MTCLKKIFGGVTDQTVYMKIRPKTLKKKRAVRKAVREQNSPKERAASARAYMEEAARVPKEGLKTNFDNTFSHFLHNLRYFTAA